MTTSSPSSSSQAPAKAEKPTPKPKPKVSLGSVVVALLLFLLELILPVLIAGGLIWYLFGNYNLWGAMDRTLALVLFGVAVVVLALILSVLLDTLLVVFRNLLYHRGARFTSGANIRMAKMALGGVILPLVLVIAANQVTLPNNATAMTLLIDLAHKPVTQTPPGEIGAIALQSENPATKIRSIQVLQSFQSTDALNMLLQIAATDSAALKDAGVSSVLSKAIAAYGLTARDPLIKIFKSVDPLTAGKASGVNSGLYERYFANSFDSLKAEITLEVADPAERDARLAKLQAAQAELKTALGGVEETLPAAGSGDLRPAFVMNTLLALDISTDKALLDFARATAADSHYSSQVRGDALLLIAKLGDKNDLDGLYLYLKGGDDLLQARCLQAINNLQDKLNHTVSK